MKKIIIFAVALGLILVVAVIATYYWYNNAISTPNGAGNSSIIFEIKNGDNVEAIATNLITDGLLKDQTAFLIYAKFNPDLVAKFQAGYFELNPQLTIKDLFLELQKAKNKEDIRVTIPEGWRVDEVADLIAKAFASVPTAKFSKTDFMNIVNNPDKTAFTEPVSDFLHLYKPAGKPLEGFLFPDTYLFAKDATALNVISKMVSTLSGKLSHDDISALNGSNYTLYDYLSVASILERETPVNDQKAMVAGIIYNRLEKGISGSHLLQMDSSMLYILKDWSAYNQITTALEAKYKDNPYNSFYTPGLPPTPICSPGLASIEAAIFPTGNDYYYYLTDNAGGIHFAKTYAEHLNNARKYL